MTATADTQSLDNPFPIKTISYSSCSLYKECPKKWAFHYVDHMREEKGYFSLGNTVHQTLYHALLPTVSGGAPIPKEEALKVVDRNWKREGYTSQEEEWNAYNEAKQMVSAFYDNLTGGDSGFTTIALEHDIVVDAGLDLPIRGTIDRLDYSEKAGGIVITDYKTGKRAGQDMVDNSDQLTLYQYLVSHSKEFGNIPIIGLCIFNIRTGKAYFSKPRTQEQIDAVLTDIKDALINIRGKSFYPITGWYCRECSYKPICPAWGEKT